MNNIINANIIHPTIGKIIQNNVHTNNTHTTIGQNANNVAKKQNNIVTMKTMILSVTFSIFFIFLFYFICNYKYVQKMEQ